MDIPRNASRSIYSVLLYGPAMQICMWIKAKHSQSLVSFSFSIIGRMHAGAAGLQLANRACIHAEDRTNLITVFTALCVCVLLAHASSTCTHTASTHSTLSQANHGSALYIRDKHSHAVRRHTHTYILYDPPACIVQ
jgi:hypothetical protein